MVKNRIVLAAVLVATFGKVFASEGASSSTSSASPAASAAAGEALKTMAQCPLRDPKTALAGLLVATALDSFEGNAVLDFNVRGDHKFVKVGALQAGLKLVPATRSLFDRLAKNELSVSANFLGEAKVQVTTGQVVVAATIAFMRYVVPLFAKK